MLNNQLLKFFCNLPTSKQTNLNYDKKDYTFCMLNFK
jgi:hypothetical protein